MMVTNTVPNVALDLNVFTLLAFLMMDFIGPGNVVCEDGQQT